MKYLLATALVAIVAAIGAGVATASSSTYFLRSTMYGTSWSSTVPSLSSYSNTSPFPAGYFNTPSSAYGTSSLSSYRLPSLSSYSGYGAISPRTGLLRTHYVHGYYRADGTYVSPYFRSCSYCR
jgi:hypothetical protein